MDVQSVPMRLPPGIREGLVTRLDKLIDEGHAIYEAKRLVPDKEASSWRTQDRRAVHPHFEFDWPRVVTWRTRCISQLAQFLNGLTVHQHVIGFFGGFSADVSSFEEALALLRALRDDLSDGVFDSLARQIEASIVGDLMTLASDLVEGTSANKCDHVPAAVLAGAVLERELRVLCLSKDPPLPVYDAKGARVTLTTLIEILRRSDVINELEAKHLRAWAGIRNACAHGHFDEVEAQQVKLMIEGISSFLLNSRCIHPPNRN